MCVCVSVNWVNSFKPWVRRKGLKYRRGKNSINTKPPYLRTFRLCRRQNEKPLENVIELQMAWTVIMFVLKAHRKCRLFLKYGKLKMSMHTSDMYKNITWHYMPLCIEKHSPVSRRNILSWLQEFKLYLTSILNNNNTTNKQTLKTHTFN